MSRHSIVTRETFAGFGGPLAIDSPRGLIKAFTGDTIITLSDGSRHVIAKELADNLFGQTLRQMGADSDIVGSGTVGSGVVRGNVDPIDRPTDEAGVQESELSKDDLTL